MNIKMSKKSREWKKEERKKGRKGKMKMQSEEDERLKEKVQAEGKSLNRKEPPDKKRSQQNTRLGDHP